MPQMEMRLLWRTANASAAVRNYIACADLEKTTS
jgi:hypothetical protein